MKQEKKEHQFRIIIRLDWVIIALCTVGAGLLFMGDPWCWWGAASLATGAALWWRFAS